MERRMERRITAKEEQKTVERFLKEEWKLTKRQISSLKFCQNGILLNGEKSRVNTLLKEGDLLSLNFGDQKNAEEKIVPFFEKITVLYEDPDVLVVDKPPGILVHPSGGHYDDTLSNQVAAYLKGKGETAKIRPVGRLDKDTSGAVLFAKNRMAASRLSMTKKDGGFEKEYLAVVRGCISESQGKVAAPIGRCPMQNLKMQVDAIKGKPALTFYETLYKEPTFSILRLRIETGRTHQIRVHMAFLGHPLLGDELYGKRDRHFLRTALHAGRVVFASPFTGERIEAVSPLPEDFIKFLEEKEYVSYHTLLY